MSEWSEKTLSDLGYFARGKSKHRPRDAAHLYGGPYPFVQTGDVKASNHFITEYTQTYSEAGLAQSKLWPVDTLCITIAANIAETGILTFPACFPDSVIGFSADPEKSDVHFVEYLLQFFRQRVQKQAIGSVQDNINLGTFERFKFDVPEKEVQTCIAEILLSIDEKIELNRKQNRTLEAIAQALFKRWYVEFEFPGENGQPYKSSGGAMQPSDKSAGEPIWTAESRSDGVSATDGANQLGEVGHVPLSDLVELNPRCTLKKGQNATYVDMKALPTSGMSVSEVVEKAFSGGAKFQQNDTLLARITPCLENGKTAFVDFLPENEVAFGSTEFIVMHPKDRVSPQFVYCLARDPLFRQYAIKSMVGSSGRQRVQVDQIAKYPVPFTGAEQMQRFDEVTKPLFDKISRSRKESIALANLRDTLLPKLMSGELRVT